MANEIFYPNSPSCLFTDSYTITDCPPVKTRCIPMDLTCLWIPSLEEGYNCTRCATDGEFCIPYVEGDQIMIQTQLPDLVSPTASMPSAGWSPTTAPAAYRAQLLDNTGAVISSDVTTFTSEYMAAFAEAEGGFSYQTLVIDTQAIKNTYGLTCWQIRVNSFESDGVTENRVVFTEGFCEVVCDEETVQVKGEWDSTDCCGNYYGEPARGGAAFVGSTKILFDNTLRYKANVRLDSGTVEKTTFNDRVTDTTIRSIFEMQLNAPIAPFMFNIFTKLHYGAKVVTIDGTEYIAAGTIDNRLSRVTNMFLFDAELQLKCDTDFNCI